MVGTKILGLDTPYLEIPGLGEIPSRSSTLSLSQLVGSILYDKFTNFCKSIKQIISSLDKYLRLIN